MFLAMSLPPFLSSQVPQNAIQDNNMSGISDEMSGTNLLRITINFGPNRLELDRLDGAML
jgi:hypothetical protein